MLDRLIKKAKEPASDEMLNLVNNVFDVLVKERKKRNDEALIYLPKKGNVIIIGDLHGDFESLIFILNHSNFFETEDYLVFLGDYGDRGINSPEVYFTVLSLKKRFPDRTILLRGNHEFPKDLPVYPHDIPFRLIEKYGKKGEKIYNKLLNQFNYLNNSAILEGKYLFLHAGLPVEISSLKDITLAHKLHPTKSYLEEVLWNDPEEVQDFYSSPRGAGKIFGRNVTERVLGLIGVKTLIRSHQPPPEGVKVNHGGRILTISSTKVYGGKAAYLKIDLSAEAKDAYELSKIAFKF